MYTHYLSILGFFAITTAAHEAYFEIGDNVKAWKTAIGPDGDGDNILSQSSSSTYSTAHTFVISESLNTMTSKEIKMSLYAPPGPGTKPGVIKGDPTKFVSVSEDTVACWQTC